MRDFLQNMALQKRSPSATSTSIVLIVHQSKPSLAPQPDMRCPKFEDTYWCTVNCHIVTVI